MVSQTKTLRSGYTTGTCAAAAAKAAVIVMMGNDNPQTVVIMLPDGEEVRVSIVSVEVITDGVRAEVIKDAGDDPDITNGVAVAVSVSWSEGRDVYFRAGEGVGMVTKPGLSIPPGEAAINPVPRRMIAEAIRSLTDRGVMVTISMPGGKELARRTFNPRLGIEGGLSILGTTGRVRPFSCSAIRESIRCVIDVAVANGTTRPVFVPGHIGARAAPMLFHVDDGDVIEVSNEWGFALDHAKKHPLKTILVMGHPGKLAKLALGEWDTHSSRSRNAVPYVEGLAAEIEEDVPRSLPTVEGIFGALPEEGRKILGNRLAGAIREAVDKRLGGVISVSAALVDMKGNLLGQQGDMTPWQ